MESAMDIERILWGGLGKGGALAWSLDAALNGIICFAFSNMFSEGTFKYFEATLLILSVMTKTFITHLCYSGE